VPVSVRVTVQLLDGLEEAKLVRVGAVGDPERLPVGDRVGGVRVPDQDAEGVPLGVGSGLEATWV